MSTSPIKAYNLLNIKTNTIAGSLRGRSLEDVQILVDMYHPEGHIIALDNKN